MEPCELVALENIGSQMWLKKVCKDSLYWLRSIFNVTSATLLAQAKRRQRVVTSRVLPSSTTRLGPYAVLVLRNLCVRGRYSSSYAVPAWSSPKLCVWHRIGLACAVTSPPKREFQSPQQSPQQFSPSSLLSAINGLRTKVPWKLTLK